MLNEQILRTYASFFVFLLWFYQQYQCTKTSETISFRNFVPRFLPTLRNIKQVNKNNSRTLQKSHIFVISSRNPPPHYWFVLMSCTHDCDIEDFVENSIFCNLLYTWYFVCMWYVECYTAQQYVPTPGRCCKKPDFDYKPPEIHRLTRNNSSSSCCYFSYFPPCA